MNRLHTCLEMLGLMELRLLPVNALQNKHYWIYYKREIIHCYPVQQLQNREIKAIKPQCTLMKIIVLSCFPFSASSFKENLSGSFSKHPMDAASPSQGLTMERAAEQVCVCLGTLSSCPRPAHTSLPQPVHILVLPAQQKSAQQPGCATAREQIQSREQPTQLVRHIMSVKLLPTHTAGW